MLEDDRLLPAEPGQRAVARELYRGIRDLPLICPHTHIDAWSLAEDRAFADPVSLFVTSDHYVLRILMSQGVRPEQLGLSRAGNHAPAVNPRSVWRTFADHWHLFRGTPMRTWIDHQLADVFGIAPPFGPDTADEVYDGIDHRLASPEFRPRALFERFGITLLATTDAPHRSLAAHEKLHADGWGARIVPTFRPDAVVDLDRPGWSQAVAELGAVTVTDTDTFAGYLQALRTRRRDFIALGARASDHGPRYPHFARTDARDLDDLFGRRARGEAVTASEADRFRAHMLMEFAGMSCEDGMVMQVHPGSTRNHDDAMFSDFGPDLGADIPHPVNFVEGLRAVLNEFGQREDFTLVMFTLDEGALARELAPMASHYRALRLGAPWWFLDSPDGMRRHRELVSETAGFYNGAGFNDDARCFTSIPARHDLARRCDSAYLARLVTEHRLSMDEAHDIARLWAHDQTLEVYRPVHR